MTLAHETTEYVEVPLALIGSSKLAGRVPIGRRRDLASVVQGINIRRRMGLAVTPRFVDDLGAPVPEARTSEARAELEAVMVELAGGRAAHAQRTIKACEAARQEDIADVDALLATVYTAYAAGRPPAAVLDPFLATWHSWLTADGVARVDRLLDHVALDRVPESLAILLLATTRLTRSHFRRRDAFIDRLAPALVGRGGRTKQAVDRLLRGLRE